tara:strand:+ start:4784 stop:4948 length:165 start_codon:yes stop_codon:yes gene_type:complete
MGAMAEAALLVEVVTVAEAFLAVDWVKATLVEDQVIEAVAVVAAEREVGAAMAR